MDAKEQALNIEIDEKTADGVYSNLAVINHSASEFVVDFISVMPGAPKARVKSLIVLTPEHAKRFVRALEENIAAFEKHNGAIKEQHPQNLPINFGPVGEA